MIIERFESIATFVAACRKEVRRGNRILTLSDPSEGYHWDGGVTGIQACIRAVEGDRSITASIDSALTDIAPQYVDGEALRWTPGVTGSRVNVADYLAGSPYCMRRRTRREAQERHVTMYVAVGCQAGVSGGAQLLRGAAVLGMLEVLQAQQVSVDLTIIAELADGEEDRFFLIPVETRPLDLGVSGFALAHPAFFRRLAMPLAAARGEYSGQFSAKGARQNLGKGSPAWCAYVREQLKLDASDVYVPYAHPAYQTVEPSDVARAIQAQLPNGDET